MIMEITNVIFDIFQGSKAIGLEYEQEFDILTNLYNYLLVNNLLDGPVSKQEFFNATILNITNTSTTNHGFQHITIQSDYKLINLTMVIVTYKQGPEPSTNTMHREALILINSQVLEILIQYLQTHSQGLILPVTLNIMEVFQSAVEQLSRCEEVTRDKEPPQVKQTLGSLIGNMELVYAVDGTKHLNTVSINVTKADLIHLLQDFKLTDNLYAFMAKHTTLNLHQLKLVKLFSNGMFMSESKLKLGDGFSTQSYQLVILSSVYSI